MPGNPETADPPGLSRAVLFTMCACVLVAQGMVAAVNLMLPQLAASTVHPSPAGLLWTVDAYVVVFAGLLIPAGACGDRYGRRRVLLAGLALFAGGSCLSAAGGSLGSAAALIAGRAVSGAGAAFLMPATMAVLVHLAGPQRRVRAIGSWTLAIGLGGLAGNLAGGLTAQYLPWPALFWAMLPLSALLAAAVLRTVPDLPRHSSSPDPAASVLLTAGTAALLYGIIEGPSHGWASAPVLLGFAVAAALLAAFARHGLTARQPLFDLRVFRSRRLRAAALGTAASFFGLFALFFVNAQFLQYVKGYSPARTGVAIVPLTVGMALMPRLAARIQARRGVRPVAVAGLALIGVGLLGVSTAGPGTPYPLYALWLLLLSAGMGLSAPGLAHTVITELPPRQAGLGAGLNTAVRELGAALGVAVVGTVSASHGVGAAARDAAGFTAGASLGLRAVAVPVLVAAVAVAIGLRGGPSARTPEPAPARASDSERATAAVPGSREG